jgi:hypothetical protein
LRFWKWSDAVRYLADPRQSELFDVFADILSPVAYRRLTSGWLHLNFEADASGQTGRAL